MLEPVKQGRGGRRPWLTPEEREESRVRQNKRRSQRALAKRTAMRAAKALAEGRIPGKAGQPRVLTDEQRIANRKASYAKWRDANRDERRALDAEKHRERRAKKAIAEGRPVGRVGRIRVLTDEQRLEKARANSRSYALKYPEKAKRIQREYYAANKEAAYIRTRNRAIRKKGASGMHTAADIRDLFKRQAGKCAFCLQPFENGKFEVDHYMPLALGGSNEKSNLRLLHQRCNRSKGPKHPIEFAHANGLLCF